ncbi:MAG: YHS domain-containing (seleno)protein [Pseudomonadota bacterium]
MTTTMNRRAFSTLAFGAAAALATPALARQDAIFKGQGLAILGADPVAYFTLNKAVEGKRGIRAEWNGATWQFASGQNRERFLADPEAYAPQFGGYCAYAVSRGYTAAIDPVAWTVHQGKLFLNFNTRTRTRFQRDLDGNIAKAYANWPNVLS